MFDLMHSMSPGGHSRQSLQCRRHFPASPCNLQGIIRKKATTCTPQDDIAQITLLQDTGVTLCTLFSLFSLSQVKIPNCNPYLHSWGITASAKRRLRSAIFTYVITSASLLKWVIGPCNQHRMKSCQQVCSVQVICSTKFAALPYLQIRLQALGSPLQSLLFSTAGHYL